MNSKVSSRKTIILREAARLFREKGYSGTNLRELAKSSGVQGGSIYHHFSSKQEILFQIMEYTMTILINKVQDAIKNEKDPFKGLCNAIRFHIEYHTIDTNETYVTDSELRSLEPANYKKIITMRDKYEQIYIQLMKQGIETGEMKVDNVKLTVKALLQMCTGVSYWFKPNGSLSISDIAEKYIKIFFWGIAKKKSNASYRFPDN
ncbi:MAG: TetR/AcrR family transcriptional regulator [Desulfobacteraceae bacterium]|nr:TetR/AcrR family transcriptional regulator [Desulfobacteraceae bacterium]